MWSKLFAAVSAAHLNKQGSRLLGVCVFVLCLWAGQAHASGNQIPVTAEVPVQAEFAEALQRHFSVSGLPISVLRGQDLVFGVRVGGPGNKAMGGQRVRARAVIGDGTVVGEAVVVSGRSGEATFSMPLANLEGEAFMLRFQIVTYGTEIELAEPYPIQLLKINEPIPKNDSVKIEEHLSDSSQTTVLLGASHGTINAVNKVEHADFGGKEITIFSTYPNAVRSGVLFDPP